MSGRAAGGKLSDEQLLQGIQDSLKTAAAGKANFTVTEDEADRVKQAFEKKEFRDMFREYLEEISDPKAREVRKPSGSLRFASVSPPSSITGAREVSPATGAGEQHSR